MCLFSPAGRAEVAKFLPAPAPTVKTGLFFRARLAEILDYLHQGLTQATENIQA
jgi:hypothetical protein